jgi:hypothetical protein
MSTEAVRCGKKLWFVQQAVTGGDVDTVARRLFEPLREILSRLVLVLDGNFGIWISRWNR